MQLTTKERLTLESMLTDYGKVVGEFMFYKNIANVGLDDFFSKEEYEIWQENYCDIIKKIITDDEIYWQIHEIVLVEVQKQVNNLLAKDVK